MALLIALVPPLLIILHTVWHGNLTVIIERDKVNIERDKVNGFEILQN